MKIKSLLLVAAAAVSAQAAIVIDAVTTAAIVGGTRYTYTFALQPDQNMRQVCAGICSLPNDYLVVYDFPGYINGTASVTNIFGGGTTFALAVENTSTAPPFQAPTDNAGSVNFRVSLTGGGPIVPNPAGSAVTLFSIVADSTLGPGANTLIYSAQAQNKANGNTAGNTNFAAAPTTAPAAVPEPSTFVLLGAGLAAIAVARRK